MKTQPGSSTRALHIATFLGAALLQVLAGTQVWGQFPTADGGAFAGLAAAALDSSAESPAAVLVETAVGTAFSYQGFLDHNGTPVSASADFQFTLWDADTVGNQIDTQFDVNNFAVQNGLFAVTLDFGGGAFGDKARWLEIALRSPAGSGAFATLSPRQELLPTPFSLATRGLVVDLIGNIGIKETDPLAKLHIQSGTVSLPSLNTSLHSSENDLLIEGNLPWLSLYGDDVGGAAAGLTFGEVAASATHKWSIYSRTTVNSGELNVTYGTNLSPTSNTKVMQFRPNGNIGIGTTPSAKLHVLVNSEAGGKNPDPSQPPVVLRLFSEYDVGQRRRLDFAGTRIQAVDVDAGGVGVFTTLALNPANGGVAIGKTSTALGVKLHVVAADVGNLEYDDQREDVIIEDAADAWLGLYSDDIGSVGSGITFAEKTSSGETLKWAIYARTASNGGNLMIKYGTEDNPTHNTWMLQIKPDGTTKVKVLEISGADIAERFPATEQGQPGMVMAIDPKNPGKLCLARGAYNRCVAGVVSGAGGVPAGAILGSSPGSENSPVIALSGRVWVHCDASERAIQPGDLLTTANRTGYAMAVSDFARATGAMIGKAMTGLSRGETGLVLVLVNLQ